MPPRQSQKLFPRCQWRGRRLGAGGARGGARVLGRDDLRRCEGHRTRFIFWSAPSHPLCLKPRCDRLKCSATYCQGPPWQLLGGLTRNKMKETALNPKECPSSISNLQEGIWGCTICFTGIHHYRRATNGKQPWP